MQPPESSLLSAIMSLVAMFLGLAIVVQIIQEIYKYITCSKSRAYAQTLEDFAGPLAGGILRQGAHPNPGVRGPFDVSRMLTRRRVLPLSKEEFADAAENTSPAWTLKALRSLELEARTQDPQTHRPTPSWTAFLAQLAIVEQSGSGYQAAEDVSRFLKEWGHRPSPHDDPSASSIGTLVPPKQFDAGHMIPAFRERFLHDIDAMVSRFSTLIKNFTYTYRRRNLRQTFTIALLIALMCNLPLDRLYQKASALSSEEATRLAGQSLALYGQLQRDSVIEARKCDLQRLLGGAATTAGTIVTTPVFGPRVNYVIDWTTVQALWSQGFWGVLRHLFGCLITALLLSFGAPVWNDITSALLRVQKRTDTKSAVETDDAVGA
jgi:hypothetical protein